MEPLSEALNAFNRFHDTITPHSSNLVDLFSNDASTSAERIRAIVETPEVSGFNFAYWSRGKSNETAEQFKNEAREAFSAGCMARALSNVNSAIVWIEQTVNVKGMTSDGGADEYDPATATAPSTMATLHKFRANVMENMGRYNTKHEHI
jgi:hypothetical protein